MNEQSAARKPDKDYPPFIRGGQRITPQWHLFCVGDVEYNVSTDTFWVCLKPHYALGSFIEPAQGAPDEGQTPKQIGLIPEALNKFGAPYMFEMPRWVAEAGISAEAFAAAIVNLLSPTR